MPYLNVRIAGEQSPELAARVAASLSRLTCEILGKKPEVTSVAVDFVDPKLWFVGGGDMDARDSTTFYLDIKVTEGTNTKAEKARYVDAVFRELGGILGALTAASYIVIHDVRADAWGFQGKTQEYRFVQAHSL
ncbi:MAG: tautomerase family protein [Gammaproteobacteria bacterium]